jgi:hypothetical protein
VHLTPPDCVIHGVQTVMEAAMKLALLLPIIVALAAPALAQAKPAADQANAGQCFFPREIRNYTVSDDEQTIYLKVGGNHFYKLGLGSSCTGLAHRTHNSLKSHGGATICQAIDLDLLTSERGSRLPCTVYDIHEMTPAQVAAMPKRDPP